MKKTREHNLYIEVKNNVEGIKIIEELIYFLVKSKDNKAYLNGWIERINEK